MREGIFDRRIWSSWLCRSCLNFLFKALKCKKTFSLFDLCGRKVSLTQIPTQDRNIHHILLICISILSHFIRKLHLLMCWRTSWRAGRAAPLRREVPRGSCPEAQEGRACWLSSWLCAAFASKGSPRGNSRGAGRLSLLAVELAVRRLCVERFPEGRVPRKSKSLWYLKLL